MEGRQSESEIVIKITPRNLERLIYILIILGLLIFSIVVFNKKSADCQTTCNTTVEKKAETPVKTVDKTETKAENKTQTPAEEPAEEESDSSGTVEFLLTDVKLCTLNETLDKGRFDTVTVSIKNGLDRQLNAKMELYLWDSNDDETLQDYPAQKIEKIKILAGAPFTHTYKMTGGMFTELDVGKTVKAVLIDTELNKKLGEQTKVSIKTSGDC
jgi:hypothetical protein